MSAGHGGQGDLVSQTGPHHPHTAGRIDWPWAAANRKSEGSATGCHSGQMPRGNGKVGWDVGAAPTHQSRPRLRSHYDSLPNPLTLTGLLMLAPAWISHRRHWG